MPPPMPALAAQSFAAVCSAAQASEAEQAAAALQSDSASNRATHDAGKLPRARLIELTQSAPVRPLS